MSARASLAAALKGIDVELIEPAGDRIIDLQSIDTGHAMTELSASGNNACSCCCCI